jgi:hypothetical protein
VALIFRLAVLLPPSPAIFLMMRWLTAASPAGAKTSS